MRGGEEQISYSAFVFVWFEIRIQAAQHTYPHNKALSYALDPFAKIETGEGDESTHATRRRIIILLRFKAGERASNTAADVSRCFRAFDTWRTDRYHMES